VVDFSKLFSVRVTRVRAAFHRHPKTAAAPAAIKASATIPIMAPVVSADDVSTGAGGAVAVVVTVAVGAGCGVAVVVVVTVTVGVAVGVAVVVTVTVGVGDAVGPVVSVVVGVGEMLGTGKGSCWFGNSDACRICPVHICTWQHPDRYAAVVVSLLSNELVLLVLVLPPSRSAAAVDECVLSENVVRTVTASTHSGELVVVSVRLLLDWRIVMVRVVNSKLMESAQVLTPVQQRKARAEIARRRCSNPLRRVQLSCCTGWVRDPMAMVGQRVWCDHHCDWADVVAVDE